MLKIKVQSMKNCVHRSKKPETKSNSKGNGKRLRAKQGNGKEIY